MNHRILASIVGFGLAGACTSVGGDVVVVRGVGAGELLKLRSGPSLQYNIQYGLPDGTRLIRRDCQTELGQLWCEVSLADAPQVTGYVSADYLSER
ncbi:SH3 domain-containing protein [Yoonia sp. 2307UL14-13]|uniref:SH3 domain-containing protein n=1 Tax=Yoonia sp. 2307UL14-13 TaxID=3126506 RepID=UPI0030B67CD8